MASSKHLVIIPDGDQVVVLRDSIADAQADGPNDSETQTAVPRSDLELWLENQLCKGSDCTIALRSHDCLYARFRMPDSKARLGHRELTYLAEACLPLSAEDMASVFWRFEDETAVLACRHSFITPLMELLTAAGLRVHSVVPLVVAAINSIERANNATSVHAIAPDQSHDHLRWDENGSILEWTYNDNLTPVPPQTAALDTAGLPDTTATITWTYADVLRTAIADSSSVLRQNCDFLSDPRLVGYSESSERRSLNSWCLAITISMAILSAALLWRVSALREIRQSLINQEDRIISDALGELPEARRNGRQLEAKLARLTKWNNAVNGLHIPDHADEGLADIFNRARTSRPQIRSIVVADQEVTLALRVPDGATDQIVESAVEKMGLSTEPSEPVGTGSSRELAFRFRLENTTEVKREN